MSVKIPVAEFIGEATEMFLAASKSERDKILDAACPIIERRLRDMRYLREFTWFGYQAFYNDAPFGIAEQHQESYYTSGESVYGDQHLKDSFQVEFDGYNFQISNPKRVRSTRGSWNLFEDLLWPGFKEYYVPGGRLSALRASVGEERWAYETRTKARKKQFLRQLVTGNLMTYFYRYDNHWFYKRTYRQGMHEALVGKFHEYIEGAVRYGIETAMATQIGEDEYEFARGLEE